MSTLIVLGYPSETEAKSAYQKILDLDQNLIVSLQSVAVVARHLSPAPLAYLQPIGEPLPREI